MRRNLFLQRLKNNTLNNTNAAIDRFSHEPKVPLCIAEYPPLQDTMPTFIRLNPISSTTMPDTNGVMMLRRYLNVRLTIISIGAAAITALCFRLRNRENQKKGGTDKPDPQEQEGKTT